MRALIAMGLSLGLLVALLHNKVKIGRTMFASAAALAVLLHVTPARMLDELIYEWQDKPITQTTGYLLMKGNTVYRRWQKTAAANNQNGITCW